MQKRTKTFLGSLSSEHICIYVLFGTNTMQIRKKWLIFKNIFLHLFAGKSHQVVKITVT
jgi:hypothetical protein